VVTRIPWGPPSAPVRVFKLLRSRRHAGRAGGTPRRKLVIEAPRIDVALVQGCHCFARDDTPRTAATGHDRPHGIAFTRAHVEPDVDVII